MRRKIILQGNRSFTLTLPVDWIRKFNLKSGDEVDVLETDEGLSVVSSIKKRKKEISFQLPDTYIKNIKYVLRQLYRQGYDRIILKYKNEKDFDIISDVAESFIGFEVINRKENQCTIEVIVDATEDKFDIFFRKLFQIIMESFSMIKEGQSLDVIYTKFANYQDFCKRYVANQKRGFIDYEFYSLLSYLINIEADLNKLSEVAKKKPSKEIAYCDKMTELFGSLEKAFFSNDFEKLAELNKDIHDFFNKLFAKISSQFPVLHYQLEILRLMYGAVSPMIGIVIFRLRK